MGTTLFAPVTALWENEEIYSNIGVKIFCSQSLNCISTFELSLHQRNLNINIMFKQSKRSILIYWLKLGGKKDKTLALQFKMCKEIS